jgi:hypothetical protein
LRRTRDKRTKSAGRAWQGTTVPALRAAKGGLAGTQVPQSFADAHRGLLRRCRRPSGGDRFYGGRKMENTYLEKEAEQFNSDFCGWVCKWFPAYFQADSKAVAHDRDWYLPVFLTNSDTIFEKSAEKYLDFSKCKYEKQKLDADKIENLYKWKFPAISLNGFKANQFKQIAAIKKVEEIKEVYSDTALVSVIFWSHVLDPLQYPLFDQRVLRTFKLLNDKVSWTKGVPKGKDLHTYYEETYKKFILSKIDGAVSDKAKFIKLRVIDWALFGFDKYITSKAFKNEAGINETTNAIISDKLKTLEPEKWEYKID